MMALVAAVVLALVGLVSLTALLVEYYQDRARGLS